MWTHIMAMVSRMHSMKTDRVFKIYPSMSLEKSLYPGTGFETETGPKTV